MAEVMADLRAPSASSVEPIEIDAMDAPEGDVTARYGLGRVARSDSAEFTRAYDALDREFGSRGELERRSVLEGWIARDAGGAWACPTPALRTRYFLIEATTARGELAAVRDCHVVVDVERSVAVVYLAHVLVLPAHRRGGLSALMRAVAVTLGRRSLEELSSGPAAAPELLLAAEMEPASTDDPPSIVRLVAYGRAGFAVIDPRTLRYAQPDFRDPAVIGATPRPLPLLAVVRRVGHEGARELPAGLAEAFVTHLYDGVFASHCRAEHLAPARARALETLRASCPATVPLCDLPRDASDSAALGFISRDHVLPLHRAARS